MKSLKHILLLTILMMPLSLATMPGAQAQESDEDDAIEEVVVTGSRLKRDTYSSIAPLQIITGVASREVGLIDAADILQESTAASGQQIDLSFQGYVLDNGPGSSTVSLRGLGEARTLVLINARRMAPSGVEGAPFAANLNVIPASLVRQYDVLLDGASSVYGSDAIAGVVNVILRKDFDGFEIDNYLSVPQYDGGISETLSLVWGKTFDRGFIGVGGEFRSRDNITLEDRPWTSGCERHHEIDENGDFRQQEAFYTQVYGMEWDDCRLGLLAARVSVPEAGSIYFTQGISNGGWENFSESSMFGFGVDGNADGAADISFRDYDLNGKRSQQRSDLFAATESQKIMAYGEYTLNNDITPYFEVLYSANDFQSNSAEGQLFPRVPALNPFNLCNPDAQNGVDCGLAYDALMNNPAFVDQVMAAFGCDPSIGGTCDQTVGTLGAQATTPIVSVAGDRNFVKTSGHQLRVVTGVRGALPWLAFGSHDAWAFDVNAVYSAPAATSARYGIRGDRLDLSLGVFSSTSTPCENDLGAELAGDVALGCVPVNMFAESLYPVGAITGDFATPAERHYLFDNRDFYTKYKQTIISGYVGGDVFEMPGGTALLGVGLEVRNDEIDSIPDNVARDGLFFGFFSDGGATGNKDTKEAFVELELPLLADVAAVKELTLNLSARYTDDELYGSGVTEAVKIGWRPVDSLLIRGTFGTSFRAPNLREVFLQAQSGFGNIFDPCFIPDDALNPISGGYDPTLDNREAHVLANCLANGVDPTLANNGGFNSFSTEVASGGSLELRAEESESWSAGISWDQPFTQAFVIGVSASYYEIEILQTIIEPSGQFIVNDCFGSLTGNSVFCDRIERDLSDPALPVISIIDSGFINRESETARGVDINVVFADEVAILGRNVDVSLDLIAHRQLERRTLFVDDEGNEDINNYSGEWGYPTWKGSASLALSHNDWRVRWETRYLGSVHQDPDGVDDFDDGITGFSDTCAGPPDDVLCRDYGDTPNYFLHTASLYHYGDRWTLGAGIRNVFNTKPPVVDGTEVSSINNTPIGYGYDINGRTYFLNVKASFGGNN